MAGSESCRGTSGEYLSMWATPGTQIATIKTAMVNAATAVRNRNPDDLTIPA
ncbi:hypothetical protein JCM15519_28320 [Fundidesulfovibrio butyratiphilus]